MDFDSLYRLLGGKIYTYFLRRTSDHFLAEDLCQTVFLKAIDAEKRGFGPKSHVSGWFFRVAHNLVVDFYRDRDKAKEVELAEDDGENPLASEFDLLEHAEKQEEWLAVARALEEITLVQAQTLRLRYLEGYGFEEIAALADTTSGAIKARRHRGIDSLRAILG